MNVTPALIERARAARAEVIAAMGTDRGYAGMRVPTDGNCGRCGRQLRLVIPDGVASESIVCDIHGKIN